jgi:hypothetical protein
MITREKLTGQLSDAIRRGDIEMEKQLLKQMKLLDSGLSKPPKPAADGLVYGAKGKGGRLF